MEYKLYFQQDRKCIKQNFLKNTEYFILISLEVLVTFRMSGVENIAMARGSLQQDKFDKEVDIANGWSFINVATLHN